MDTKRNKESAVLERRFVPSGSVIMKEGERGATAFLIQSGIVRVSIEKDGKAVELARMGVGQIFGEMALVFDEPRTATVEAMEDCNLIIISRQTLQQKLDKSDPTVRAIVPMLMKRIIVANNAMLNREATVETLVETVNTIYENMQAGLGAAQRKTLQNAVLPKLDEFLNAVRAFDAKYKNEAD
ncbi:MAG: cyclic nucleotide-binding domain-containing protein [Alphaproteobacteria bacterium]|nr:cyclic nucleotide-binding domain-containing protein [Alphaproteobacteria bacterium]MBU0859159.1 cyclic nucleotide-binding domain-containing protein [Alphaproteobacteria bacterium]